MRSADAIKTMLEQRGHSQRLLALDLGFSPQALDQEAFCWIATGLAVPSSSSQ